jgi:hypothetical protein
MIRPLGGTGDPLCPFLGLVNGTDRAEPRRAASIHAGHARAYLASVLARPQVDVDCVGIVGRTTTAADGRSALLRVVRSAEPLDSMKECPAGDRRRRPEGGCLGKNSLRGRERRLSVSLRSLRSRVNRSSSAPKARGYRPRWLPGPWVDGNAIGDVFEEPPQRTRCRRSVSLPPCVNKFGLRGRVGRWCGWGRSQPGAHLRMAGVFTSMWPTFTIIEHSPVRLRRVPAL